jgi:hypothetical protein
MVRLQEVEALNRRKKGAQRACEVRWIRHAKKGRIILFKTFTPEAKT